MRKQAERIRRAGRYGDTELVHVNRRELAELERMWGRATSNPKTGLPEFFLGGLFRTLAPMIAAGATEAIGGAGTLGELGGMLGASAEWAPTVAGGIIGAGAGAGANWLTGHDPLEGALTGGLGGAAVPSIGRAAGFTGFQTPWNIPTLFDLGSMFDAAGTGVGDIPAQLESVSPFASSTAAAAPAAKEGAGWLARNPWAMPVAAAGLSALAKPSEPQPQAEAPPVGGRRDDAAQTADYKRLSQKFGRRRKEPTDGLFFSDNQLPMATGGALSRGRIKGPGDARADVIPAMLSNDEYVMDGETMALLGNGSPDAGADKLDQFRVKLRKHKGKQLARGKFSADAKPVEGYL
jgi:hypothetical protein